MDYNIESKEMSSLGLYHKFKHKELLEEFIIYRDMESCAYEKGIKFKKQEITDLKDIILKFYEEDSITNYPLNHTTKFITNHYLDGDISIKELKANSWSNIYNAIEDDNIELLRIDSLRNNKKTNTKIWKDNMKEIILLEISNYCTICPIHDKCLEDDCVLFRIEIIILNSIKKKDRKVGNKNDKCSNISR